MNAILEAIKKGYTSIYCFGFDFLVIDEKIAMSNMFDGTKCYGLETRANLNDTRNRMKYLGWLIEQHSGIKFFFCYPKKTKFYQAESENVFFCDFDKLNIYF
jgi:hypothetical protein